MRVVRLLIAVLLAAGIAACAGSTEPTHLPAFIEIVDGDGQEALGNQTLPDSLRVRVTDRDDLPVPGALVEWTATSGAISPSTTTTDASGVAAARWAFYDPVTGWSAVGTHRATATVPGAGSVTFTSHAKAGVVLRALWIAPDSVNVAASAASVAVTLHATDDRTGLGLSYVSVQFYNPTANSTVFESLWKPLDLTAGTPADGAWKGTITVPQGAETGVWTLGRVTLGWGCGPARRIELFDSHLQSLGLPYQLIVTAAPAQGEASLIPRGGTVPDGAATPATPAQSVAPQCS
jgi:hypothetical protein